MLFSHVNQFLVMILRPFFFGSKTVSSSLLGSTSYSSSSISNELMTNLIYKLIWRYLPLRQTAIFVINQKATKKSKSFTTPKVSFFFGGSSFQKNCIEAESGSMESGLFASACSISRICDFVSTAAMMEGQCTKDRMDECTRIRVLTFQFS